MQNNKLYKFGGTCAILAGISISLTGIAYLIMPVEQQTWRDPGQYLSSFAQNPLPATIEYFAQAFGAIFALAMVIAVSEKVRPMAEGWVRWTGTLAIIANAVLAVQYFRETALGPARAAAYVASDAATRAAIAANQYLMLLDPIGWVTYGSLGLWFLVINVLAIRSRVWPRALGYVGVAGGVSYWLLVAGMLFQSQALIAVAAAAGIIAAPIWCTWIGLRMSRWI